MGTVIDELVVSLKLDPTQFDDGTKKSVQALRGFEREHERHTKKIAQNTNSLSQSFAVLQGRLLGVAALFMGGMGIASFTDHIVKMTAQTGYLAASLGLTTKEVTRWQAVGAMRGASSAEMAGSIKSVRDAASDLASGRQNQIQKFSYMTHNNPGPAVNFTKDTDPTEFMISVSRWLEYHKKQGPQAFATANRQASSMLGFGQGTMNVLGMGPDALRKQLKDVERYAPTEEETKKLQQIQEAQAKATTAAEALGRTILTYLTPSLTKFLDTITRILDAFRERGLAGGFEEYGKATSQSMAETAGTARGFGRSLLNWGKKKLGMPVDESTDTPPGGVGGGTTTSVSGGDRFSGTGHPFDRSRFIKELQEKTWLKEKFARISLGENTDPKANLGVIEEAMNRANNRGTSLEKELRHTSEGGYSEGYARTIDGKSRAMFEANLAAALGTDGKGQSNTIGYATDNASGGLAQRQAATGRFNLHKTEAGESFFSPGSAEPKLRDRWRMQHARAVAMDKMNRERADEEKSRSFNSRWDYNLGAISGAGAAVRAKKTIQNNTSKSETNVGQISVHVPGGGTADGQSQDRGLSNTELKHHESIMHANEGLL